MRIATSLVALGLAVALLSGCAGEARKPAPPTAASLAWLEGHWVLSTADGSIEETWLPPADGTLHGAGRTISGGVTRFDEVLSIEPRDGPQGPTLAYVAQPRGGEPTEFLLVEISTNRVVFSNPQHDFPKRIIYQRTGDQLNARVDDGTDFGEGEDFVYTRKN